MESNQELIGIRRLLVPRKCQTAFGLSVSTPVTGLLSWVSPLSLISSLLICHKIKGQTRYKASPVQHIRAGWQSGAAA